MKHKSKKHKSKKHKKHTPIYKLPKKGHKSMKHKKAKVKQPKKKNYKKKFKMKGGASGADSADTEELGGMSLEKRSAKQTVTVVDRKTVVFVANSEPGTSFPVNVDDGAGGKIPMRGTVPPDTEIDEEFENVFEIKRLTVNSSNSHHTLQKAVEAAQKGELGGIEARAVTLWAAKTGKKDFLSMLINPGVVPGPGDEEVVIGVIEAKDEYGRTPLWLATQSGHTGCVFEVFLVS